MTKFVRAEDGVERDETRGSKTIDKNEYVHFYHFLILLNTYASETV